MRILRASFGYLVLLVTPAALLARALVAGDLPHDLLGLEGAVVLTGGVAAANERGRALGRGDALDIERGDVVSAVAVAAAAVLTHALGVHAGFGPVVASALVGLSVGTLARDIAVPAYCGSFVGMASPKLFPSVEYLAVAGLCSGLAFVVAKDSFDGFGGKLGTLALFGCAVTATLTPVDYAAASALPWATARHVVPVAVVAAVATVVLSVRLGLGGVVGSALVGLVVGLALPVIAPNVGERLAVAAFCASFVGMSSSERLDGVWRVASAGAVCGLVFVAVSPAFAGAGGKLGTVAFVACATVVGAEELRSSAGVCA